MAADIGALQRLPRVIGNASLVNELCLTGRKIGAKESLEAGLVSKVFKDKERYPNITLILHSKSL